MRRGFYGVAPVVIAGATYYNYSAPRVVYAEPRCWLERRRVWSPRIGAYVLRRVQICED